MEYLPMETQQSQWTLVIQEFETLFQQIYPVLNKLCDFTCLFLIMSFLLKITYTTSCKVLILFLFIFS
jgi:hypothetical protein